MAYTTIDDPTQYFNTVTWTGDNATSRSITGVGHQPNFVWIKHRNGGSGHHMYDSVRGVEKRLRSDTNAAESSVTNGLTAFNSDGFTVGNNSATNGNGNTFVAWCWKEDTTAGFDIISYSGSSSSQDISHGLGVKPDWILNKITTTTGDWNVYHDSFALNERIKLNSTGAKNTNASIFDALPDSSVIHIGTSGDINTNGATHVFWAWRAVKGFSKFGSYTGNGNADGTFVYTGFNASWIMLKRTDTTSDWSIYDIKREAANPQFGFDLQIEANDSAAEGSDGQLDIHSNGFKFRSTDSFTNASSGTYIYMAFAESPFVNSKGIPTNAR